MLLKKLNGFLWKTNTPYTTADGRKMKTIFVTFHIRNATLLDDSNYGPLGRYECHAYAVGNPTAKKHGFSVNVIRSKLIRYIDNSNDSLFTAICDPRIL